MPLKTVSQTNIFVQPISDAFPELKIISKVLDNYSERICEWLDEDFGWKNNGNGRKSIGSETYLRLAYLMILRNYTYKDLFLAIHDSKSVEAFSRIDPGAKVSKSALHNRISKISSETWMGLSWIFLKEAIEKGLEFPEVVRGDSTFVSAYVHFPTDWKLMHDVNSCIIRLVRNFEELSGINISKEPFSEKKSKNKLLIANQSKGDKRKDVIHQLIIGTHANIYEFAVDFQETVMQFLESRGGENKHLSRAPNITLFRIINQLKHVIKWGQYIVTQAYERVVEEKKLSPNEKVLSLHDPSVDLLVKGKRDIVIGHKLFLSEGKGGMILSAFCKDGNPSDSTILKEMLEDIIENTEKVPKKITFDGGFASKNNVLMAKDLGVEDVCFSKKCNMKKDEMCSSNKVFNELRKFRAGVESCFSYLKRNLGLFSVRWKGYKGFNAFIAASVSAYNAIKYATLMLK